MMTPADGHAVRMSDAELEHIFDLPAGYLAAAPADVLAALERCRADACAEVEKRVHELLHGRESAPRPVGLMAFIEAASPTPLLPYQRDFLAGIAVAPQSFALPQRRGKSRLASEIKRLAAGLTPRDACALPAARS